MTPEPSIAKRELDRSLVHGIAWVGGLRTVTKVIQWAATLLVVRLLAPSDYGLVAMAEVYLALARMVTDLGLGSAIIQHRHLSEEQVARVGGVSAGLGALLFLLSLAAAPLVARIFGEPEVGSIIVVLSITLPVGGYESILRALLKRDLEFRRIGWLNMIENLTGAFTSLGLAALGFGFWSLVYGAVAGKLTATVVVMTWRRHRITWPRELHTVREQLWFGWNVLLSRIALYVRRLSDVTVVGRVLGSSLLGIYNVAWTVANLPVDRVTSIALDVTPAVFASAKDDDGALRRYLRLATEGVSLFAFPATIGLAVVAEEFVLLVLGETWSQAVVPLQILAITAALRSITPFLSQVLIATEQPRREMLFSLAGALVLPVLFLVGSRWGIEGVAIGWLIGHPMVGVPMLLLPALRAVGMSAREYLVALMPATLASSATATTVLLVQSIMPMEWPLLTSLLLKVSAGVVVYALVAGPALRKRLRALAALRRPA